MNDIVQAQLDELRDSLEKLSSDLNKLSFVVDDIRKDIDYLEDSINE